MNVEHRKVSALIPYADNSRTHSEQQVAQIAASIKEFGWTNPILVDGENGIIAGHGRVLAARQLGIQQVPVIELSGLTDVQRRAYIIADNKLALNAGWDDALLAVQIEKLGLEGFDLEMTGFDEEELDKLIGVDTKLKEHDAELKSKKFMRVLISVPIDSAIDAKDLLDQLADVDGIEIDYGAN